MTSCLTEVELHDYVAGRLAPAERTAIEEHAAGCDNCHDLIDAIRADQGLIDELRQAFEACIIEPVASVSSRHNEGSQIGAPTDVLGYQILEELHRGGQGIVYRAIQTATKRTVALKVLLLGPAASKRQLWRFEREIDLVARLQHPNIVTLYDSGICQGRPYFAMQFIPGWTIDQFVGRRLQTSRKASCPGNWLPIRDVLLLFHKVCAAVSYAHQNGVIHRDLKPGNVLVDEQEEPHIVDFGLAKLSEMRLDDPSQATHTGEFLGTLAYASPEQAAGDPDLVDVRTDVYSLGVILYEMLTGSLPYEVSGSISATLRNIRETEPRHPAELRSDLDDEICTLVLKSLAKEPERRYQTAEHFARDVGHYLAGEPIDAKQASTWYLLRKSLLRHRTMVSSAAILMLVVLGALAASLGFWRLSVLDRNAAIAAGDEAQRARQAETAERAEVERQRDLAEYQVYVANIAAAAAALRTHDAADATQRLKLAPSKHRGWEWHHLQLRLDESLRILRGHTEYVENVAVFRERPWAVSTSWDKSIRFWNIDDGRQLSVLTLPSHAWSVALRPDETEVAVGAWDGQVRVWSVPDGKLLHSWQGPAEHVTALAYHPDGQRLAAAFCSFQQSSTNEVVICDASTLNPVRRIPLSGHIGDIAFDPHGQRLAVAGPRSITLWDAESGNRIQELPGKTCVAWHPRLAQIATVGEENTVVILDTVDGRLLATFSQHTGGVTSVSFSSDGQRLASASRDKTVRLWDARSGKQLAVFVGHTWSLTAVAFHNASQRLVSTAWDNTVRVWDANRRGSIRLLDAHEKAVTAISFSADGLRIATASLDHTVCVWNAKDQTLSGSLRGHTEPVQAVCFSPDSKWIASASVDTTVRLWHGDQMECARVLAGHSDRVHAVAFSPDSKWLVSGSRDNTLRRWDTVTGRDLATLRGHDDHIHCVVLCDGGRTIASAGHRSVKLWDVEAGQEIASFPRTMLQDDFSLAVHPEGALLAAGVNINALGFWDARMKQPVAQLTGHTDEIRSVAFSPNGKRLVSASLDGSVKVWDVERRIALLALDGHASVVNCVAFAPDGRTIVGGLSTGQLAFWEIVGSTE